MLVTEMLTAQFEGRPEESMRAATNIIANDLRPVALLARECLRMGQWSMYLYSSY
jgi:hypothetical protein